MKAVQNYTDILLAIKSVRDFKEEYITNFFPDRSHIELCIAQNEFFELIVAEGVVLFLKKNKGFFNLYFCAKSYTSLAAGIESLAEIVKDKLIVDLVGAKDVVESLKDIFDKDGFQFYTSLTRMSRKVSVMEDSENSSVSLGTLSDSVQIHTLLEKYFDPLCEQIPYLSEIENWLENKRVCVCKKDDKIVGFVIFDLFGVKSYLRYWFVHPEFRNMQIGSVLLRKFFKLCETSQKQIFWVIDDNYNAIKRYEHYGFIADAMHDYVLIK